MKTGAKLRSVMKWKAGAPEGLKGVPYLFSPEFIH